MENINLEDLDDKALIELMTILETMDDELKEVEEAENNEEN